MSGQFGKFDTNLSKRFGFAFGNSHHGSVFPGAAGLSRAFSVLDIAGAALWLRADQGVQTSSGFVTQWSDLSGNGRHMVQAAAGSQPTFTATGISSQPSLVFNKSVATQFLTFTDGQVSTQLQGLSAAELFVVAQNDDDGVTASEPCCFTANATINYIPFTDRKIYDNFFSNNRYTSTSAPAVGAWSSPYIYGAAATAADWEMFLNGVSQFANPTNTLGVVQYCTVGASVVAQNGMQGKVAEVIIYDHRLSTTDRARVIAYLKARYGIP